MADLRPFLCLQITDNVKIFLEGGPKAMADLRPFLCLQIIDNVKRIFIKQEHYIFQYSACSKHADCFDIKGCP